jgi:Protein of unknown function (DUF3011)
MRIVALASMSFLATCFSFIAATADQVDPTKGTAALFACEGSVDPELAEISDADIVRITEEIDPNLAMDATSEEEKSIEEVKAISKECLTPNGGFYFNNGIFGGLRGWNGGTIVRSIQRDRDYRNGFIVHHPRHNRPVFYPSLPELLFPILRPILRPRPIYRPQNPVYIPIPVPIPFPTYPGNEYRRSYNVVCDSVNYNLNRCYVGLARNVYLVENLSAAGCYQGSSYGFDGTYIWVTNGCRGDFLVVK